MGFVKRGKLRINEDVDMMMLQFCPIVCLTESCPWKMMDVQGVHLMGVMSGIPVSRKCM